MSFYSFEWTFFILAVVVAAFMQWYNRRGGHAVSVTPEFSKFQWLWLVVYYLVMFADWLQGPYVYALYESYGLAKEEIAILFVTGFGSSAVFGTFVGSIADKFGRKRMSIAFGIFYSTACLLKTVRVFWVLMLGRLLSGIATSLLFSVFEAWMVSEHNSKGFDPSWIGETFSVAIFGNGVAAILAGVVASFLSIQFGFISPFMLSMVILIISAAFVSMNWTENYGNSKMELSSVFSGGFAAIQRDIRIPLLGTMQSLFEGSMYVFVFMWTPILSDSVSEFSDHTLGLHGLTFASFMACVMLGSTIYGYLRERASIETMYLGMLGSATAIFFIIAFSRNGYVIFFCFMLFELMCGLHFTLIGMLRSKYIPEDCRSAVMNLFRVPLNVLVVLILIFIERFNNHTVFLICAFWLAVATFAATRLRDSADRRGVIIDVSAPHI